MPELPEVETVRRDLCRLVCGSVVKRVELLQADMLIAGTPTQVKRALKGATLTEIARHGKALILRWSSGCSLIVHFRMTGQLYPVAPGTPLPDHTRTIFHLADGRRLLHVDVRRLGTLELVRSTDEAGALTLAQLGPDALGSPPTLQEFRATLARHRCAIKPFLLDQRSLSGIGNIYASEILARARVGPETPCNEITAAQARTMLAQMKRVLVESVEARGTTISDYRTGTGAAGGFQGLLRVYGREGERCLRRGCSGRIARIVQGQRSTYYCPVCQPLQANGKAESNSDPDMRRGRRVH